MMIINQKLIIKGRLIGLNEHVALLNRNRYEANNKKQSIENDIIWSIRECKLQKVENYPIMLKITWYEPNKRRDVDNITFAVKFIQDALVKAKIIKNDGQKQINKIEHEVLTDKENPRVEVEIVERK